ncbi:MAG: hypothetical protein WKF74_12310 [Pyrinomonadaceae bacterium]
MKSLADILFIVVALIALVIAVWQFIVYVKTPNDATHMTHLWYAIIAAVIACACALGYFLRHVNKEEEIHITQ